MLKGWGREGHRVSVEGSMYILRGKDGVCLLPYDWGLFVARTVEVVGNICILGLVLGRVACGPMSLRGAHIVGMVLFVENALRWASR